MFKSFRRRFARFQKAKVSERVGLLQKLKVASSLSKLAYDNPPIVLPDAVAKCHSGYPKFISIDDSQAYLWRLDNYEDTIFLAFRGTSTLSDVVDDLDVRQSGLESNDVNPKIKVHTGFARQLKDLEKPLMEHLEQETLDKKTHTLVVTGHSLGGALATLSAPMLTKRLGVDVECYTFGAPRVGNVAFRKWYSEIVKSSVRIVNENDPVPLLPMSFRFTHACPALVFDDDGQMYDMRKDIPWTKRLFYTPLFIDYAKPAKDHDCNLYMQRINDCLDSSFKAI